MRYLLLFMAVTLTWSSTVSAGEIDFVEDYALAKDRTAALKQLVPGTEDFYYYHALHFIQTEQLEKLDAHIAAWVQRHGETQRVWEIRTRHALAAYDKNPQKTLDFLRSRLGLNFPHQKEELNAEPNFPIALDPSVITRKAYTDRANAVTINDVNQFEDSALDWLSGYELNPNHRRSLLSRLTRPDHAQLVKLIVEDLNYQNSGGFGSHPIHRQLLLAQLEELLKAKPELLNQQNFVTTYLVKLQPTADEDWRHNPVQLQAFLTRLTTFANRLAPVQNSLKGHVLYHQLLLDRLQGNYNKERFVEYLKLPRHVGYLSQSMAESEALKRFPTDLNADYGGATLLHPIGNDEPLVRSYLMHFLLDAANTKEFEPYVNSIYLQHLFAEVKIVNGLGEAEQWASLLPPALFQQLKERVDIDFAFTNKTQFGPDEPVKLDLFVKNAGTMIVKVFEINTKNYYREQMSEVDTDISLDGLVANVEQTHPSNATPLRRIARKFEFPQLDKPGVYIIDFIGNGRSSRALIRKGRLRHLVRTSTGGQVLTILNEKNEPVENATVWLSGHEYTANKAGSILVPFTATPVRQPIVISSGGLSSLDYFQHEAENHTLTVGFYVDRESLLKRKTAQLLIRAGLSLNGTPVSPGILEEIKLTITSTDLDGVASAQEIPDVKLFQDRESIHEFQVPPRLASLAFQLSAKVKKLSAGGQKIDLSAGDTVTLNQIDRTEKIEGLHLAKNADGYLVELRGKTGEPRASRAVQLAFKHHDFRQVFQVTLKTDPAGRIHLGTLTEIDNLSALNPENTQHNWYLRPDEHTYSQNVQGQVGEPISVPYLPRANAGGEPVGKAVPVESKDPADKPKDGTDTPKNQGAHPPRSPLRTELSLLEVRNDIFVADRFEHLSLKDGLVVLEKLPAGDFDLLLKSSGTRIHIRVTEGPKREGFVLGQHRQLETPKLAPLQIESITPVEGGLRVKLQNATKFTRVHVFATRFVPEYDVFQKLGRVRDAEPYLFQQSPAESVYLTGRNIGDEYRYIIDRKYAPKFPGNTLDRPALLLNPWAVRSTETGEQQAGSGGEFAKARSAPTSAMERASIAALEAPPPGANFANLDFLATASAVLVNLVPNEAGIIEIKSDAIGTHQHIHVCAVDPVSTTYRSIALPEPQTKFIDLRLVAGLDPQAHFTQQKQITVIPAGQALVLNDITTSKFEAYDSLARVYGLYLTLNRDPKLVEFSFLLNWPKLKPEEKRTLYSKHASHELSFFLSRKDPEFFNAVIKPYLANKKDLTFVDHYLLDHDLTEFALPWNHGQLNIVERILLARRLKDEGPRTARHVGDLYQLLPPNIDRFIHLFDTAVQRSALELDDALGLKQSVLALEMKQTQELEAVITGPLPPSPASDKPAAAAAPLSLRSERFARNKSGEAKGDDKKSEVAEKAAAKKMPARDGVVSESRKRLSKDADRSDKSPEAGEGKPQLDVFFDAPQSGEALARQLYRKLDKTMEWAENNYYHLTIDQQNASLITVNAFWNDFAKHDAATPFVSRNLAEASRNFPEMLLALAVLDLPFEAPKHETKFDAIKMTLQAGGPLVVFHEEIKPAAAPDGAAKVLVSQNFFRNGDRTRIENGEQVDKFISEEFLVQVVYGCQVVITNPTSTKQKLNVLLQIPRGAIPVLNSQTTKTVHLDLEPYHTQTLEYHFYFPGAGKFPHFPVHVAKNETLIAASAPILLNVVDKPTKIDTGSWDYVSQFASTEDVLKFLDQHNIDSLNLDRIAWRMQDAKVFETVLTKLAQRHIYQHTLWSYSLKHNVVAAAREFLQHADQIVNDCGGRLSSTLLTIDPVRRHTYEHLEYKPLVNARAHALGKRRQIVNDRLFGQYHQTLKQLSYVRQLDDNDLLAVTYYLLVQDRIEEALATFARVNVDKIATKMQYDYCAAYLDFFTDDHKLARVIATKYVAHPVDRWRQTFAAITAQLDEAEGRDAKPVNEEDRNQQQTQLAATEPNFDVTVEAKQIKLDYQNLAAARINFYEMDVELLFSRNPFVQQFRGQFSSIKPNLSIEVSLAEGNKGAGAAGAAVKVPEAKPDAKNDVAQPAGTAQTPTTVKNQPGTKMIPLPAALQNKNVLVEVVGAGQTKTQAYYSHSLAVQVIENYGQIKVTHQTTGQPISKAYVKVYAQLANGTVKFYKDGYTDLRGRFDYSSLNSNDLDSASKFSILVLSDEHGALVREAAPPKR
jgi:hypothetical protein